MVPALEVPDHNTSSRPRTTRAISRRRPTNRCVSSFVARPVCAQCHPLPVLYSPGSILPGASKEIPVVFLSSRAGIFTEQWLIRTTPRTEVQWSVTLTGSCAAEDRFMSERKTIEVCRARACSVIFDPPQSRLEHNSVVAAARAFVLDLINRVEIPSAEPLPREPTIEEQFVAANPKLAFVCWSRCLHWVLMCLARWRCSSARSNRSVRCLTSRGLRLGPLAIFPPPLTYICIQVHNPTAPVITVTEPVKGSKTSKAKVAAHSHACPRSPHVGHTDARAGCAC